MKKRIKISVNEIVRENKIVETSDIQKILRRKYIKNALEDSEVVEILVFPSTYIENYTVGNWTVSHKGSNQIITLKDVAGSVQVYDIEKLVKEKEESKKKEQIDLFENVIEQARLIYLTGKYKDFECAFKHIENRITYEKKKGGQLQLLSVGETNYEKNKSARMFSL